MARDIQKRLTQLRSRRAGTDHLPSLSADAQLDLLRKSATLQESWQKRTPKQYTGYALGAMQEVGPDYTRICVETAERVGNQLQKRLSAAGLSVEFRLQGSVPLNTHIRGASDVDLLNLDQGFYTYAPAGARSRAGLYGNPSARTSIDVLKALRTSSEQALKDGFHAATVDTSGGKAITISGGSLPRTVDVIPSHWHDTVEYQVSSDETDRAVTILNKHVPETLDNLPFIHIKRVHGQDAFTFGGLKKAIRLCKNVKSDTEEEGKSIGLSSYDIAAVMYHANLDALRAGLVYDLAILVETQRHLDWLFHNKTEAQKLVVPDGSRKIFDTAERVAGLTTLSLEMDDLLKEVAKEQGNLTTEPMLPTAREILANVYIPAA